jgi:RHS repeat-associated protein
MCSAPTGGNACTPHPINIGTGNKFLSEVDIPATAGGLEFRRFYNSQDGGLSSGLSVAWRHNYSSRVEVSTATGDLFAAVAVVSRPDGRVVRFVQTTGNQNWVSDSDVTEQLSSISSGGAASGYQLIDAATDRVESYDLSGVLISVDDRRSGRTFALAYDENNRLSTVTDRSGRQLLLAYDATGRITDVWEPDSVAGDPSSPHWTYSYDISLNRLSSVTGPDQSSRVYAYENSSFVYALTGITDENGNRYATYAYDAQGRASGENLWAGNSQTAPVSQYTLSYQSGNLVHVTDPLSHSHDYQFNVVQGMAVLAALSEPCMLCGGSGSTKSRTYDPTTGFTDLVIDFDGTVTDYDYNSRGLEAQRIEAKTTTGSSAPAEKRTTQTDWHATFRVPTQRRVYNASNTLEAQTSWAYNSRGQATARCEADPSVSGATTYTCGSLATAPAGVRQWLTTYCEQSEVTGGTCPLVGLTKSTNGPRATTDAGMASLDDTTTYTYYQTDDSTCASGGACPHRHGDLWKVTNALSQVTTYVNYDKNGRVTRMQDANGTYTDFVYHPRGWLTDRIVRASAAGSAGAGDATTHIDYDAVGNVTKVTQPDSAYLAYTYDDAHRLIKIADNQNNTIDYCPDGVGGTNCLDAAGNRKVEQVKDPSGVLKRSLSRTYNTLSQLTQVLNHASQPVEHSNGLSDTGVADGYDGNGNRVLVQDGLNTTTKQTYDGLNRLVATIQNYNGTDTVTANTTTGYTYDTRDNLRQVTDPDGLNTVYTYDGLNNLTGLSSPDTGNSTYTYDKAGNRITQTDNRSPSVTSTYTYDALNRLTAIAYPTTTLNVTYAYDQANATTGCTTSYPIGRLTTMTDGSGSTTYCYDRRGNVTQKKQVTSGVTLTTQYSYTLADRLASLTYPSGAIVTYSRDSVGRITTVTWKANATATATTLVSNATYYPFGPLNVLTFGNGRTLTKTYDQDYAIDSVASSASTGLKLDLGVDVMGDIVQASGTIAPTTPDRQYGYDPLYRLTTAQTGAATPSPLEGYTYGKTGDRLGVSLNGATPTTYTYTAGSHRLASVGGTARTYDGNGNTQTGVTTGFTFTYDDKNRLSKAQQSHAVNISYVTNGRGERVNKNGTTTTGTMSTLVAVSYSYNEGGQLLGDYAATTGVAQTEYVYLDGVPIAVVKGMSLAYVETDHLGTPRQVVDPATNTALWTWDLLASTYGTNAPNQSPTGGAAYMLNLRFPGQYFDAEMGLNYNYFRDYEPTTGRYAESDPIGLFGGSSTYGYARNRSINFVDRKGLIAGALPLPWIWEIPPWAKNPVGLCLFAVTYSTPLSSNDEITPAVPQPGTCPNTQPPANDSQCRTSDYCRQMHDMLEAWRLGLISELSELLGDTQGALGADPGWAALHQWIIQDIRNFNEAVDKYNAICDPKIDRFANRPIP